MSDLCEISLTTRGLFLAYIIDLATHSLKSSASWRIPIGLQLIWGMLLMLGAASLPESPRLLLGKGKREAALKSIASLNDCKQGDVKAQEILEELDEAIAIENAEGTGTWLDCFSKASECSVTVLEAHANCKCASVLSTVS